MTEKNFGIITRGVGGLYGVRPVDEETGIPSEEVLCRARGIFRQDRITPTVGDAVRIAPADVHGNENVREPEERGAKKTREGDVRVDFVIDEILPRRNLLLRPPTANLDYLFAVLPAASPAPDLLTADKLTVIAENYGIETVVIVNKADLDGDSAARLTDIYRTAGYRVFPVSAERGDGMDALAAFLAEMTAPDGRSGKRPFVSGAFAGVSGGGKSTLMTALFPELQLKTGGVSRKTERGRHTTRHVEIYPLETASGGRFWLADTPGFSMLDFTRFNFFPYDELASSFREFGDCLGRCRYTKCTHLCEEGCAVIEKRDNGKIAPSRHESYVRIYEEQRRVPEWKRR
ncbi:MAG: ribosome small subunit-dependent GTPase A [Eubacteriales bacterium]